MRLRYTAQIAAGIAIAGAGLWVFFRGVDIANLGGQLARCSIWSIALGSALSLVTIVLRAVRWRLLLPQHKGLRVHGLFGYTIIGFMINNIVPARAGEAARAFLLWRKGKVPLASSIGSIVVERILDTLTYALFFVIPVFVLPGLEALKPYALIIFAAFSGGIGVLVVGARFPVLGAQIGRIITARLPGAWRTRFNEAGHDLAATMDWAHNAGTVMQVALLSVATSLCYALIIFVLAVQFAPFGFWQCLLVQSFAVVGAAIPLAPGYVGTLHSAMLQGFSVVGVPEDRGRALAIIFHAINYVPVTLVGLIYFFRTRISFGQLTEASVQLKE